MKWDEAAVEAAIRALPVRSDGNAPTIAEAVETIRLGVWIGQGNSQPRARGATRKQTMDDLQTLCELCRALFDHMEHKMRSPALRLVEQHIQDGREERARKGERPLHHPLLLTIQLQGTFEAARAAWIHAKNGAELPQPVSRGTKPAAKDVTFICGRVYESVTGQPATRNYNSYTNREGGAFIGFLQTIFDVLGLKAKAAGQAKLLLEKRAPEKA